MNVRQYDYRVIIDEIINKLRQSNQAAVEISPDSQKKLDEIKRIAWDYYSDNVKFDNAALNRKILLDTQINCLLTSELLKDIFAIAISNDVFSIGLARQNTDKPYHPTIVAVIQDALKDGVDALGFLSNHDGMNPHYQKSALQYNTTKLLTNILNMATELGIDLNDFVYLCKKDENQSLHVSLENIGKSMDYIMALEGENRFLATHHDLNKNLEQECMDGFSEICKILKFYIIPDQKNLSPCKVLTGCNDLNHFAQSFIYNQNAIMEKASDFFLDAPQLQAAISLNTKYRLGNTEYGIRDILKAIFIEAEKDEKSELYQQLKLRIQLIEKNLHEILPREYLPDNALRMIQLLEKYSVDASAADKAYYDSLAKRLMKAKSEEHAGQVFEGISVDSFNLAQFDELKLTACTNESLLNDLESPGINMIPGLQKKYRREIAGRLLRTEKIPGIEMDIEKKLNEKQYRTVRDCIAHDFAKQTESLHGHFSSKIQELESAGSQKATLLNDIFSKWIKPAKQSNGAYASASMNLFNMRNQFLSLQEKIPDLKEAMKEDRNPLLSHIHAAFVALGCIAVVGLPFTCYYMYRSWRDKGTVLFTHAPDTMKISHTAEKFLMKVGRA